MCTLTLPPTVINIAYGGGQKQMTEKPPKVAWEMVMLPKKEGGLGVLDLRKQNEALLKMNLHKFYNKHDVPLVNLVSEKLYPNGKLPGNLMKGSFWWRSNLKILKDYKDLASVQIRNGETCQLWEDN